MASTPSTNAPFGTVFAESMAVVTWKEGSWASPSFGPLQPLSMHPGTHVFHYASECFEGMKAHKGVDGKVRIFRADGHVARMQKSAELINLPIPPTEMLLEMILGVVSRNLSQVPDSPGSLYVRPTLIGTDENIGAAAVPVKSAMLFVIASPVGDYFAGGIRPLKLLVETVTPRTTPQFGVVKAGANYVQALGPTMVAKREYGMDQVLFAPDGQVQETGAANFLMLNPEKLITPALTPGFLHGITRSSILQLASDLGYEAIEKSLMIDEVIDWAGHQDSEAALSGTAAVLSAVGHLLYQGEDIVVGSGEVGSHTMRLRDSLTAIQLGKSEDRHGWTRVVE